MRLLRICVASLLLGAIVGLIYAQTCTTHQERWRYESRTVNGVLYYVEIYETRQRDCDSQTVITSDRQETFILPADRPAKVNYLNDVRQRHVLEAQQLQARINDLNALPLPPP